VKPRYLWSCGILLLLVGYFLYFERTERRALEGQFSVSMPNGEFTISNFKLSKKYGNFSISAAVRASDKTPKIFDLRCTVQDFGIEVSPPIGTDPKNTGNFTSLPVSQEGQEANRMFWGVTLKPDKKNINHDIDEVLSSIRPDFQVSVSEECMRSLGLK